MPSRDPVGRSPRLLGAETAADARVGRNLGGPARRRRPPHAKICSELLAHDTSILSPKFVEQVRTWGGPPGPRPTPSSAPVVSALESRTGGFGAGEGARPTAEICGELQGQNTRVLPKNNGFVDDTHSTCNSKVFAASEVRAKLGRLRVRTAGWSPRRPSVRPPGSDVGIEDTACLLRGDESQNNFDGNS